MDVIEWMEHKAIVVMMTVFSAKVEDIRILQVQVKNSSSGAILVLGLSSRRYSMDQKRPGQQSTSAPGRLVSRDGRQSQA
jgi:hypothetical protein